MKNLNLIIRQKQNTFIFQNIITVFFILFLITVFNAEFEAKSPRLDVPANITIGESPQIRAINLTPGKQYKIAAEMIDSIGRKWESNAAFVADYRGIIEVSKCFPVQGDYAQPDAFGLLWSMEMKPKTEESKTFDTPRDFNEINYQLIFDNRQISTGSTKQWIIPRGLKSEKINGDLVAEVFYDSDTKEARPGILLLGGSGGGMYWARRQAAILAKEGYVAMALAYFNADGLPKHLAQIPLEYVDKAIDRLADHPQSDKQRLAIMGYSKGAELALLISSRRPEIKLVVAYAPPSAVFQGFKPPEYPVISSWSSNGEDVPFVPNAYDKKFFQTRDGMYLWYRTLRQYKEMETAAIPIEKINGGILLISGAKDTIWASTLMAEQMIGRLRLLGLQDKCIHLVFGEAGHGIAAPPGEPLTRVAERLGGTAYGNAKARESGWNQVKKFLSEKFKSPSAKEKK